MENGKTQKKIVKMANIKEDAIVVRHNTLMESRHKLTLQENRLLLWLISEISIHDTEFTRYTIGAKELANFIGIESNNIYSEMKKTTKLLLSRVVEIENKEKAGYKQFQILSEAEYDDGVVEIEIHRQMQPLLLQLKENFTKVELKYALRFSGIYAARVYDILKLNKFKRKSYDFDMKIIDLRSVLGLEKCQYKLFSDFRKWVLQPAQKEINTKTDIKVEYKYKKTGRKITCINFHVTPQGEDIPFLPKSRNDKILKRLEKLGFKVKDGAQLIEEYKDDPTRISFHIDYVENEIRQGKKVKNPAGLLNHIIKEDRRPQTSFREELFKDDAKKIEKLKNIQAEITRFEKQINDLTEKISQQAKQYHDYRIEEIVSVVERIARDDIDKYKTGFSESLGQGIQKDMFNQKGWTHRLITRDVIAYLQEQGLMGEVLTQEQWERKQGLQTKDQIEEDRQGIESRIKTVRHKSRKNT